MLLTPFLWIFVNLIKKSLTICLWGNGSERKSRLLAEGYDYGAVQKRVNEMLS